MPMRDSILNRPRVPQRTCAMFGLRCAEQNGLISATGPGPQSKSPLNRTCVVVLVLL